MDFIEQLLASEGHMAILVIVNHLTKQSLFISFLPMTPSTPQNWPNCSSPMCSRNMACHPTSPLTGALSLYPTSSDPSVNYSGWNSTSHQDTTWKGMDRQNALTRSWSNISGPI